MPKKAKFGFGSSSNIEKAIQDGKINARDILFLDEDTANPKVGWVTPSGEVVVAETDLSEVEAELAKKANIDDVDAKLEAALAEHHTEKYEVANVPNGTLVDYGEKEIRIMCPKDSIWIKQTVGNGGDPNCYYMTFKTYVYDDNIVGYKEHLGTQVDAEILTDLKTDEHGRRYQPTWLALAKYDEAADAWTYYGANSTKDKYIGWDYQIDFFDANNQLIASDSIRINLSNEDCHSNIEPYYVGDMMKKVETMIASIVEVIEF